MMRKLLRRIRGALGNALTWGVAWFTGALAISGALLLSGVFAPAAGWWVAFLIAKNMGITGFVTGGAFSLYLGFAHRKHQLHDLSAARLAAVGGVLAAGTALASLALAGGMFLPMGALILDGAIGAVFGAVTAGGTILLSQRSSRHLAGPSLRALEEEQRGLDSLIQGPDRG